MMAGATGLDIQGSLGGSIVLATGSALNDFEIELGVDLAETSIEVPSIGWVKLPAEPGKASMRLVLKDGMPLAIEDIDIAAEALRLSAAQALFRQMTTDLRSKPPVSAGLPGPAMTSACLN